MKMRLIGLWTMYIIAAPILVLLILVLAVWSAFSCVRNGLDFEDYIDILKGLFEGFKIGHDRNMHWVRYNEIYEEVNEEES